MVEKHGKPNWCSNNTAHYARKKRAMITRRENFCQHNVKSLPSADYSDPTCQRTRLTSHLDKAYRLHFACQHSVTKNLLTMSKIIYSHWEHLYSKQNKKSFGCSLTQKAKTCS